jgi:hypothetical protein
LPSTRLIHTTERPAARNRLAVLPGIAVFALVFAAYNANGREIGSYDSQPTKFAAIELAQHRSLTLDSVVLRAPALGERPGFTHDRSGHYRSAYPVLPAIAGGVVATALDRVGILDLAAPGASSVVAKITASLLAALSVVLVYAVACRSLAPWPALLVALGFGLGTNVWAVSSQTLWQSETALAALCGVVLCLAVGADRLTARRVSLASLLLGFAGAARPQLAVAIAVLSISIAWRYRGPRRAMAFAPLALVAATVIGANLLWFGHPLGAIPRLESIHAKVHGVASTLGNPLVGAAGLLVSPSRGLLVFSPVVLVALAGLRRVRAGGWRDDGRWWALAALAQFAFYASYGIWWGGHTYGPRYGLDLLPLLVPLAVAGVEWIGAKPHRRVAASLALAWSIALAATGAFVYPNEAWNTRPDDVDTHHARLWDFRDPQFVRCWRAGLSPQNFGLFRYEALRRAPGTK